MGTARRRDELPVVAGRAEREPEERRRSGAREALFARIVTNGVWFFPPVPDDEFGIRAPGRRARPGPRVETARIVVVPVQEDVGTAS